MTSSQGLESAHDRLIYFKLAQYCVAENGLPSAEWISQLAPQRDNNEELPVIKVLRLPTKVAGKPIFQNIFTIVTPSNSTPPRMLEDILRMKGVIWAEIAPIRLTDVHSAHARQGAGRDGIDAPPNDPNFSLQWALFKIHALAGWDVSHGNSSVVIAIVDIGTDFRHSDLAQRVWVNQAEADGQSGVDDDGNGYIDDVNGWDFYDDDPDPRPRSDDRHGTHVAGIACAGTDNGYGIAGVSWNCNVMPIRAGVGRGITHGFEGLIYAVANGADIVNLSWGGDNISQLERIAVEYATEQGCLVVAAAGNLGGSQSFDHYPAAYDNVLAVASTDEDDKRSEFSNTGSWVDVSAPGSRILSLFPNQLYGIEDGTSMASPLVAGVAGLLKALRPDWTPARLKKQLEVTCDPIDDINGAYAGKLGKGRINLYRALAGIDAGVVINRVSVVEPTGDGVIDPGERIQVSFELYNPLLRTSNISIRMISESPLIFIDDLVVDSLTINPNETIQTGDRPLQARISANVADNVSIKCNLEVVELGGETSRIPFTIVVRKSYETIRNDQIAVTIADMGSLGYYDYPADIGYGEGFRYPAQGLSALFHGSLMVGASGNRVSDNAYGNAAQNSYDFNSINPGVPFTSSDSAQILTTHFSDDAADTVLGLDIRQNTTLLLDVPDNNYALLEYMITLRHGFMRLNSVFVGLYLDWDINHANENALHWESESGLGWMNSVTDHHNAESSPVFGVGMVGRDASFYAGINRADVNQSWTDSVKSEIFRSGFARAAGETSDDWAQIIGVGPFSLAEGETLRVSFALVGGDSVQNLTSGLRAARARFGEGSTISADHQPETYGLLSVFPTPFNSRTTVLCKLGAGAGYRWALYDAFGREALRGEGIATHLATFPILLDAEGLPAGYYVFQLKSVGRSFTSPLILLK